MKIILNYNYLLMLLNKKNGRTQDLVNKRIMTQQRIKEEMIFIHQEMDFLIEKIKAGKQK